MDSDGSLALKELVVDHVHITLYEEDCFNGNRHSVDPSGG